MTTNPLVDWAARWGVPPEALEDLARALGPTLSDPTHDGKSEAWAQSAVRLEAAQKGIALWRNNVGVLQDANGRPVRFGLANDSPEINRRIKSGDLIGIKPVLITPAHVGQVIGQFVSREVKRPGWQYKGEGREVAQQAWILHVLSKGGDAAFTTGPGSL